MIKLIDNNLQKFFIFFLILMFSSVLSLSSRNKSVLSDGEKNILKNLRITPANIWLKANDFSALDSSGLTVSLNDFKGKFVLLNFWATWCYPCLKEMPDLEKAYQNLGEEKLAIVAVAMGENVAKINKFSKKNNFTFPLLSDENMEITKLYGVKNIPVTFLIDSNGLVLGRAIGIRDWSSPKLMGFIKSRLKKFKQKI